MLVLPEKDTLDYDPPLTKVGIAQAILTGRFLRDCFEKNEIKPSKIVVRSSPFIRTIMTASAIAS